MGLTKSIVALFIFRNIYPRLPCLLIAGILLNSSFVVTFLLGNFAIKATRFSLMFQIGVSHVDSLRTIRFKHPNEIITLNLAKHKRFILV